MPRAVKNPSLSHAEVLKIFRYDPATGYFVRVLANGNIRESKLANGHTHLRLRFHGHYLKLSRLIHFYVTGKWPNGYIDHIDGNPLNNRWANLRDVTHAQNMQNRKMPVNNTIGFQGVVRHQNGFRAKLSLRGRTICLGVYKTPEEAGRAYLEGKRQYAPMGYERTLQTFNRAVAANSHK